MNLISCACFSSTSDIGSSHGIAHIEINVHCVHSNACVYMMYYTIVHYECY